MNKPEQSVGDMSLWQKWSILASHASLPWTVAI